MINQLNQKYFYYAYWLMARFVKSIGVLGILGIVISIASILLYALTIMPLQAKISEATYQFEHTEQSVVATPNLQIAQQNTASESKLFYAMLPSGTKLSLCLAQINNTAIKQGLIFNRGDYKLSQSNPSQTKTSDIKNKISRYEIVLPLIGKYTQLRPFLSQVLKDQPALALTDVQIRRENTLTQLVEARLVFVLFIKGDSW